MKGGYVNGYQCIFSVLLPHKQSQRKGTTTINLRGSCGCVLTPFGETQQPQQQLQRADRTTKHDDDDVILSLDL